MTNYYVMCEDVLKVKGNNARIYQLIREDQRFLDLDPTLKEESKMTKLENPIGTELNDIDNGGWADFLLTKDGFYLTKEEILKFKINEPIGYKCIECGELIVLNYTCVNTDCSCGNISVDSSPRYTRLGYKNEDRFEEVIYNVSGKTPEQLLKFYGMSDDMLKPVQEAVARINHNGFSNNKTINPQDMLRLIIELKHTKRSHSPNSTN